MSPTTPLKNVDQGHQCAALHPSIEVMDRRVTIVTERHIAEMQRRARISPIGRCAHAMTQ